ncbi:MAG TPA: hypothetical protein VGN88_00935 [Phycisphaerae bacterium]|jgi:hypothetical protein
MHVATGRVSHRKIGRTRNGASAQRNSNKSVTAAIHPAWVSQIERLQRGFGLNQIQLASELLHCSPRSLILWKSGSEPNAAMLIRLHELWRLYQALGKLMPASEISIWLKQTNDYLDPLTPLEVLNRGQIDRLWHIIHNAGTGMPT